MRDGNVDRGLGAGGQRDADDRGAHRVVAGSAERDREPSAGLRPGDEGVDRRGVEAHVDPLRGSRGDGGGLRLGRSGGDPRAGRDRPRIDEVELVELPVELELGVEPAERDHVGSAPEQPRLDPLERRRGVERHQPLRDTRVALVLAEALAQLGLGHPVEPGVNAVERAELRQQIGRRLRPHPRDAGDVVARVAGQREVVAHAARGHAELLAHLGGPVDAVAHRVPHHDAVVAVVHELHQVLVGADDDDLPAVGERARRHGGDEVVGLEPLLLEAGDVPGADDLLDAGHLLREIRRRGRPGGLVPRVEGVAECPSFGVHGHREPVRLPLGDHLLQHVHGAEHRVRRLAARARERRQRVVRAKDVPRDVDEVEDVVGTWSWKARTKGRRAGRRVGSGRAARAGGAGRRRGLAPSAFFLRSLRGARHGGAGKAVSRPGRSRLL